MVYLLLGVASVVVKVVAKPLLLLQKKPPPEADKSPGPPKLAITVKKLSAWELPCWSVLLLVLNFLIYLFCSNKPVSSHYLLAPGILFARSYGGSPDSYTHMTLPTILLV